MITSTDTPHERLASSELPIETPRSLTQARTVAALTAYLLDGGDEEDLARGRLAELLPATIRAAFTRSDASARLDLFRTLYAIYELSFANPLARPVRHERSPWLAEVRGAVEEAWLADELPRVEGELPPAADLASVSDLRDWFVAQSRFQCDDDRRVVRFLAEEATTEHFDQFLLIDCHLNYRFHDALALTLPHYSETVKAEICRHVWDECGEGDPERAHTRMFSRALASAGATCPTTPVWEDWRPYAGFDLYFLLGMGRRHYFKALGSLAMPELFDPDRDRAVITGVRRLGLDAENDFAYYSAHIDGDEEHSDRWLDHVIRPVVESRPEAAREVAIGAALRMEYMRHFNRYLVERFSLA